MRGSRCEGAGCHCDAIQVVPLLGWLCLLLALALPSFNLPSARARDLEGQNSDQHPKDWSVILFTTDLGFCIYCIVSGVIGRPNAYSQHKSAYSVALGLTIKHET